MGQDVRLRRSEAVSDQPAISILIPCRNEANHIESCLRSVLGQEPPEGGLEVIVADGLSDDGTRQILECVAREDGRVRIIDNPGRIASTGLNAALAHARADIVIRVDGHAVLDPDFVRQNLELLKEHPEAWSTGGPIVHCGRGPFGKAVAFAMSHPLGVGNATHRFAEYEGYAEGAAFPAIRRWVFERVGLFDEQLVRNQDDEFNYRMKQAGGKVYISPRVRYQYFVRERLRPLFRQYFQYGFWRVRVLRKHRQSIYARYLVPMLFYMSVVLVGAVGVYVGKPFLAALLPMAYASALILAALQCWPRMGFLIALRVPLALAVLHAAYAWGFFRGLGSHRSRI
ncbi:MAG: glycosyltransferase family 2 protein [Gemmatimonadetes bacterium]|nr:glycosyltransferase family 2 protein [Gemmatimonadota bacterium]